VESPVHGQHGVGGRDFGFTNAGIDARIAGVGLFKDLRQAHATVRTRASRAPLVGQDAEGRGAAFSEAATASVMVSFRMNVLQLFHTNSNE
jgi:hypothetical protein